MEAEKKAEYKKLQRQCQEAYNKLFDKGSYGRIPNSKTNLFNNRLERMHKFCIDNGLSNSRWLKINPIL